MEALRRMVFIPTNPEQGYLEHCRYWMVNEAVNPREKFALRKRQRQSEAVDHDQEMKEDEEQYNSTSLEETRQLTSEACDVLSNLNHVTNRIFHYLPFRALKTCLEVCQLFEHHSLNELSKRQTTFHLFTMQKPFPPGLTVHDILYLYRDELRCRPAFLIGLMDPKRLDRRSATSSVEPARSFDVSHMAVVEGTRIFAAEGSLYQDDLTLSSILLPPVPGFCVRTLMQKNTDHAVRLGTFAMFQNGMDDLPDYARSVYPVKGILHFTTCSRLGTPETITFGRAFCGLQSSKKNGTYIFCGEKVFCASVWLAPDIHRGSAEVISRLYLQQIPEDLLKSAVDSFALFATKQNPICGHTKVEVESFRQLFPKVKLIGCESNGALFGNSCSSAAHNLPSNVSWTNGGPGASVLFLVAVLR